jgi:thiopeptide-type bacteriocin biosynthesis protein
VPVAVGEFFVLRTPLLPFDTIEALGDGLTAAAAVADPDRLAAAIARDLAVVGARLRQIAASPLVREAIFIASPDLVSALDASLADESNHRRDHVDRSLLRYVVRLSARPTPFGLFAATTTGPIAEATNLAVAPACACSRHTRLDTEYASSLAEGLARTPAIAAVLRYRPNTSLFLAAGHWRFVETRLADRRRTHHLVAVENTPELANAIARAHGGATRTELADVLVTADVTADEAESFIKSLIDSQILISELDCSITGPVPLHRVRSVLERVAPADAARETLAGVAGALATLDGSGPGADTTRYGAIAERVSALPANVDPRHLFQVDLVRPAAGSTLGAAVVNEIVRGAEILRRLTPHDTTDELAAFRDAFVDRYEGRAVPLLEALDEDSGVGSALTGGSRQPSPLLRGLEFPGAAGDRVPWSPRETRLLEIAGEALRCRRREIELTIKDLDTLSGSDTLPLPDACAAMVTLAAPDAAAVNRGQFRLLLHTVAGPSGATLLGRFCHADADLAARVRDHLRDEAARDPDAVYAEIVHLPEGRLGNILLRPVLRDFEIPFLGASGAPDDRQLQPSDLTLAVEDGRFVLRSVRLGRRVVPRLTTAHNFRAESLGVYRLLCLLQSEGRMPWAGWTWGPAAALPFLPRVSVGRLVLARATWNLAVDEIRAIDLTAPGERFRHVQHFRASRDLPRWTVVADGDNALPIDLDNPLAVDTFAQLVKGRDHVTLTELFPGPDELCARGPDGRYVHEIVVPFLTTSPDPAASRPKPARRSPQVRRTFAPGSKWTYAKLYCGTGAADAVLTSAIGPVSRRLMTAGHADRWFFVRYADPDPHLRWRVQASRSTAIAAIRAAIERAATRLMAGGLLHRLVFDTYEREVERYGGARGIAPAEAIFWADSEAAIDLLGWLDDQGDRKEAGRWQLVVAGADRLLNDFGFDLAAKLALMTTARKRFGREFSENAALRRQFAASYRGVQPELSALLDPAEAGGPFAIPLDVLMRRSLRVRRAATRLRRLAVRGDLSTALTPLLESHIHMHANRLFRSEARRHELVVYDFMACWYRQQRARQQGRQ